MIPEKDQHIKCLLRNGFVVEGFVESWSLEQAIIKDLDGKSMSIILRPTEDIVLIKIMLGVHHSTKKQSEMQQEIASKLKEVIELPSDDELRIKSIAELKILSDKQEKEIIAKKLKEHRISEVRKTKYEYPGLFKKQST